MFNKRDNGKKRKGQKGFRLGRDRAGRKAWLKDVEAASTSVITDANNITDDFLTTVQAAAQAKLQGEDGAYKSLVVKAAQIQSTIHSLGHLTALLSESNKDNIEQWKENYTQFRSLSGLDSSHEVYNPVEEYSTKYAYKKFNKEEFFDTIKGVERYISDISTVYDFQKAYEDNYADKVRKFKQGEAIYEYIAEGKIPNGAIAPEWSEERHIPDPKAIEGVPKDKDKDKDKGAKDRKQNPPQPDNPQQSSKKGPNISDTQPIPVVDIDDDHIYYDYDEPVVKRKGRPRQDNIFTRLEDALGLTGQGSFRITKRFRVGPFNIMVGRNSFSSKFPFFVPSSITLSTGNYMRLRLFDQNSGFVLNPKSVDPRQWGKVVSSVDLPGGLSFRGTPRK